MWCGLPFNWGHFFNENTVYCPHQIVPLKWERLFRHCQYFRLIEMSTNHRQIQGGGTRACAPPPPFFHIRVSAPSRQGRWACKQELNVTNDRKPNLHHKTMPTLNFRTCSVISWWTIRGVVQIYGHGQKFCAPPPSINVDLPLQTYLEIRSRWSYLCSLGGGRGTEERYNIIGKHIVAKCSGMAGTVLEF